MLAADRATGLYIASQEHYTDDAIADEVKSLPGWAGPLPSKWFSGMLPITESMFSHYIYVQRSIATTKSHPAPLVLWSNGGPGASSMFGLFTELGPLVFSGDKLESGVPVLVANPYSWASVADLLIFDAPPPIGFSYCNPPGPAGPGTACLSPSLPLSPSLSHYRSLAHTHARARALSLSVWLPVWHCISLSLSLSLARSLSVSLSLGRSRSRSRSLSVCPPVCLDTGHGNRRRLGRLTHNLRQFTSTQSIPTAFSRAHQAPALPCWRIIRGRIHTFACPRHPRGTSVRRRYPQPSRIQGLCCGRCLCRHRRPLRRYPRYQCLA